MALVRSGALPIGLLQSLPASVYTDLIPADGHHHAVVGDFPSQTAGAARTPSQIDVYSVGAGPSLPTDACCDGNGEGGLAVTRGTRFSSTKELLPGTHLLPASA